MVSGADGGDSAAMWIVYRVLDVLDHGAVLLSVLLSTALWGKKYPEVVC